MKPAKTGEQCRLSAPQECPEHRQKSSWESGLKKLALLGVIIPQSLKLESGAGLMVGISVPAA